MKRYIDTIVDYVANIRKDYPNIKDEDLLDGGKIYYMNGNDGTRFDWGANDRLCEFMVHSKKLRGFIAVYVEKNDRISANVWEDFGAMATKSYPREKLPAGFAEGLKNSILRATKNDRIFDSPIDKLYKF